jgi:DNA-directed RNA polymerase specialized sigma24 family protein
MATVPYEVAHDIQALQSNKERAVEILWMLSPLERAVLLLSRCHGLTCEDIAARVGISVAEVQQAFVSGLQTYVRHSMH